MARRARVVGALLASTASLAAAGPAKASRTQRKLAGYVMDDYSIRTAVAAWFDDRSGAETTYGHISTWATGGVTDMSQLFCVRQDWMEGQWWYNDCVLSTASFNEDISAWDTSGVTSMEEMFKGASAFNQDLGWCVDDGVFDPYGYGYTIQDAFDGTPCAVEEHLLYENASCEGSDQGSYLGTLASVDYCAVSAAAAGCTKFMFSESYPSWGCRCCSAKTQTH